MNESLLNVDPDAMIEYGKCDCGERTYASWNGTETVFICDDCREYFKGGFNVVIELSRLQAELDLLALANNKRIIRNVMAAYPDYPIGK